MTFGSRETSRTLGQPDTLYRFTVFNSVYAYTDAEESITFNSVVYRPIPINRDAITTSGSLDKAQINIKVQHDTEIAELFRVFPPSEVVGVTIFQGHADDPDNEFLAIYSGRVVSCQREASVASLTCEPINTSMMRPGLRRRYQYGCPHALYGSDCKADRNSFTWSRQVLSIDGASIIMEPGWELESGQSAAKFTQGLFEYQNGTKTELRTIIRSSVGSQLILLDGIPYGLSEGDTVKVSLGCNHKGINGGDCSAVFNNILNFGGQPFIPTENPVGFVNRFY